MQNFWQKLKKPIIGLAPMDGVTDWPMRQIVSQVAKPDVMYTEFVSVEGFIRNSKSFEKKLFFKENERPLVVQLFGYTPEAFYETISKISKLEFDGIDINMGCPAKSVLDKGGGGALIGNNKLAEKIILSSLDAIKKPKGSLPLLSIKTRIGKNETITGEWIKFLSEFPISEISIHGRLLSQLNKGSVDWREIGIASQICRSKKIICLGNGGVKSVSEAKEKSKKYVLNGILIGQAACGNPWVFKEDHIPSKEEILKTIINHAKLVEEFYGKEKFVTILKHFSWYPRGFPNSKKLKVELLKTRSFADVEKVIEKFS